jgi:hypothetical protein
MPISAAFGWLRNLPLRIPLSIWKTRTTGTCLSNNHLNKVKTFAPSPLILESGEGAMLSVIILYAAKNEKS